MQALIHFFFDLCLLRRAPQDLPASDVLLRLLLVADIATGFLVGVTGATHPVVSLAQSAAEVGLMLGLLALGLRLSGHPARFNQSATALLGTGVLIGLLALAPLAVSPLGDDGGLAVLGSLALLGLLGWSILITGHILRHTFGLSLAQGVGIALAYQVLAILSLDLLFGGV